VIALFAWNSTALSAQLTVNWDDNSTNETGFKIERAVNSTTFSSLATVGANIKSYVDTTVSAGATYSYRVHAYNSTTTSAFSNVATATVPGGTSTAPKITTQPASRTVTVGSSTSFSVTATGSPTPTYQWRKAGTAISGATGNTLNLSNVTTGSAGVYSVVVKNSAGSVTSANATLTVNAATTPSTAPKITTQPASKTVTVGSSTSLSVTATGSPTPTYQWRKAGTAISGATSSTLNLSNVTTGSAGVYSVVVKNSAGSVTSSNATLTVNAAPSTNSAPKITSQPTSQSVAAGRNVSFVVAVSGNPAPTLQWRKNGVVISGATSSTLALTNITTASAGSYTVVATNSSGSVTSSGATLTISAATSQIPGRLSVVTARTFALPGKPEAMTMNFKLTGESKSMLLRGIGPGLASLSDLTTADPNLSLYTGSTLLNSNDNWGGSSTLRSVFTRVGAFALSSSSKDAAILATLSPRSYSVVTKTNNLGLTQTEVYDADTSTSPTGRITSISARASVGAGETALIVGFVVKGDTSIRLVVRAIGPSLSGVQGTLADPKLVIHRGTTLVKSNDNWGGGATLSTLFKQAGLSTLNSWSKDAAVEMTLAPGTYTATASGASGRTGVAQVEIVELR
jgi:hypothetical protein